MVVKNEIKTDSVQSDQKHRAIPGTTCGPTNSEYDRSIMNCRRLKLPHLKAVEDTNSIGKDTLENAVIENGEKSVKIGRTMIPVVATERIVKPKISTTENCSNKKSHLLSKTSSTTKSVMKGDIILKGKLSSGMKTKRPKNIHGTPDK